MKKISKEYEIGNMGEFNTLLEELEKGLPEKITELETALLEDSLEREERITIPVYRNPKITAGDIIFSYK